MLMPASTIRTHALVTRLLRNPALSIRIEIDIWKAVALPLLLDHGFIRQHMVLQS